MKHLFKLLHVLGSVTEVASLKSSTVYMTTSNVVKVGTAGNRHKPGC